MTRFTLVVISLIIISLMLAGVIDAKIDKKNYITAVLLGDGECHEGSIWEAAMFASFHKLNNLLAVIDRNGLSATDFIENYIALESLEDKWKSFGWNVEIVDGHSFEELLSAMMDIRSRKSNKPIIIIANTTKGKGVSFMENKPIWHYRIPVGEELQIARRELEFKE